MRTHSQVAIQVAEFGVDWSARFHYNRASLTTPEYKVTFPQDE
jgi:hypothetical protein